MKINLKTIKKLNPCKNRLDIYKNHYNTTDFTLEEFLKLDKITYTDKVWVATRLFTKKQNVLWSIKCAESVLRLFESLHPEDKRPRDAIEAAKAWTIKQDESASSAASSTGWFAAEAASSASWSAWSASSAAWSAESAAATAWSASAPSAAANSASWSAWFAARSASSAVSSAAWFAAEKQQEELNLKFMLEVYNETKGE